ncbi:Ferredoxin--NADP reductase [Maioricimonas rarisocia]|uniref:ferredoxin--NADP(+) reductase n=1 Tax=Maioricimonas rarisocia TaxID=2528026 RepID=A0A517ZF02_9PLAN|nr:ferredoxin--NADP reductase [Maioricimonas rarisocia]QDU41044.1 Ferredoxin--NADP reductase [Maioricimonas rarisocia]
MHEQTIPQPVRPHRPALEYNATVIGSGKVHDELLLLEVRLDRERFICEPGQYTTLALGGWEPRVDGLMTTSECWKSRLVRRAYSVSSPMLDPTGSPVDFRALDFAEFYIALVLKPTDDPPQLTPRMFKLKPGDRIHMGPLGHGTYNAAPVGPDDNLLFIGTGTGEAPHNAMAVERLRAGHKGRIAIVTSVRYRRDLAYIRKHRRLEEMFDNYRYVPVMTREAEIASPDETGFIGRRHVQELFSGGELFEPLGWEPSPENTHIYLCGNPAMIGAPQHDRTGHFVFPEPPGMVELLLHLGYRLDRPRKPGNVHFEKYW